MDFISPFIDPIIQCLMEPIKKHIGFFVSSTKLVEKMRVEMQGLNNTALDMQNKKDEAEANNEQVPLLVSPWLVEFKETDEKAKSVPTGGIRCFNVAKRYKVGKTSSDIVEKIDKLEARKSKIEWTHKKIPLGMVRSTSAPISDDTEIIFESRKLVIKNALKYLNPDSETQKIALTGMSGVGKTFVMEKIKIAAEEKHMFDWVMKVVVGEKTDPITIQQAIAEYMDGEGLTETTKDARADRLRKKFEWRAQQRKKVLVIIDDLWNEFDLKDIGLMSPLPSGFKLLITSQFYYVCTKMGVNAESIFTVGVLNDTDAKTLFFGIVGPSVGNDHELKKIGEVIVKKCGGLPIAIKTIANSLRDDIKDAWKDALSNLQHGNLELLYGIVDKVFEMSYNNLKIDDAKTIFLLSGIFPADFDIPIEDLMRYGWGLKLFKELYTSIPKARRRTNTCVHKLIQANMLLTESDRDGCVKRHDLFVMSNFSKVKQASVVNHEDMAGLLTKYANDSYDRILLMCTGMSEFPAYFNYPNLSLLILKDGDKLKFPPDFYERMKKLEVVSYENMNTPLLPKTYEQSTQLRTLCLRSCSLMDDLSFLGNLSNLETLTIADCNLVKLPSTIGNLRNLKLLDLLGCGDLCIDDGVFQNLASLEELYMRAYEGRAIKFTDANCAELEILSQHLFALEMEFCESKVQPKNLSFKQLERFRISMGCKLSHNKCRSFRNELYLKADCKELLECKINVLFEKTDELLLQVNNMNHLGDTHPFQDSFYNLRVLRVNQCEHLTYLFTFQVAIGLKKLERLVLIGCPLLEVLVGGNSVVSDKRVDLEFERDTQPPLGCQFHNLKEIIFPNLDELYLKDLPCLKGIGGTGDMWSMSHKASSSTTVNNQFQVCMLSILRSF
ncbi:NB-ARC domains-containing protein [Artemisia annua]|uniref:NB-ARC domains-containing protein n=1 Tax=Artemisia annua TaxID=35608 RepID=A0A2U1KPJ5_ARTAN|nr:NB-ARC domains-containing protein [Artemisia annua]